MFLDAAFVKTCVSGESCQFMTVADAKGLDYASIASVEAAKGESDVTRALSPTFVTMSESIRSLQAQKAVSTMNIQLSHL